MAGRDDNTGAIGGRTDNASVSAKPPPYTKSKPSSPSVSPSVYPDLSALCVPDPAPDAFPHHHQLTPAQPDPVLHPGPAEPDEQQPSQEVKEPNPDSTSDAFPSSPKLFDSPSGEEIQRTWGTKRNTAQLQHNSTTPYG